MEKFSECCGEILSSEQTVISLRPGRLTFMATLCMSSGSGLWAKSRPLMDVVVDLSKSVTSIRSYSFLFLFEDRDQRISEARAPQAAEYQETIRKQAAQMKEQQAVIERLKKEVEGVEDAEGIGIISRRRTQRYAELSAWDF